MRAFLVRMPTGVRYWTVVDDELRVVPIADAYVRHVRFGRDGAESTTKTYAGAVALYLSWCEWTGSDWRTAVDRMGLFILWLRHAPSDSLAGGSVVAGPGSPPVRGPRRINVVLAGVRGFLAFAVDHDVLPGSSSLDGGIEELPEFRESRCSSLASFPASFSLTPNRSATCVDSVVICPS